MKYIIGWNEYNSGPAGVIKQLEISVENLKYTDICFLPYNSKNKKLSFLKKLFYIIVREKGNVINIHSGPYLLCFLVMLLGTMNKKNQYILTVHGFYCIESKYRNIKSIKTNFLERVVYKKFDNIICVSEFAKKELERIYNRTKNITVIENGYLKGQYKNKKIIKEKINCLHCITVGGMRRRKGIIETVQVIEKLRKELEIPIVLDIYGVNIEKNMNDYVMKEMENHSFIIYHGEIQDKDKLFEVISQADIHFALSEYDTFNIAVIEALSVGCPTITTTKCGAASHISSGCNGLVVDLGTDYYIDIFRYIKRYSTDYEYRLSNINNAADSVKNMTNIDMAKKYYQLFCESEKKLKGQNYES